MSKDTTGAFGASRSASTPQPAPGLAPVVPFSPPAAPAAEQPQIFDHRDRLVVLTPIFAYQGHEANRRCLDYIRSTPLARFRQEDGSVALLPVVAEWLTLPNDSHVDRARNVLSHLFLQTPYRFAVFIDNDIEIEPPHIARLWQHLMQGRKFVCGLYAMKTIVPTFVANVKKGATVEPDTGLIELNDGGTGCMALDRDVFETIRAVHPGRTYRWASNTPWAGAEGYAYFTSGVVERGGAGDWLSEDWKFCHDWKVAGGQVWGDTQINLRHWGPMCFPPTVGELVEAMDTLCRDNSRHFTPELRAAARPALKDLLTWTKQRKTSAA